MTPNMAIAMDPTLAIDSSMLMFFESNMFLSRRCYDNKLKKNSKQQ